MARIKRDFGFEVPVLVLGAGELARVVDENPFLKQRGVDLTKLHVTFLAGAPAAAGLKKMEGVSSGRDAFRCLGTTIYLVCPDGYGNTKLSNNAFERALAAAATTRNWKTVTTLAAMASSAPGQRGRIGSQSGLRTVSGAMRVKSRSAESNSRAP